MPDNEPSPAEAVSADGPGIGERLRAAREQRGLTVDQLGEHVRLDERVILALEADDFDALGAPVFVRGHLKTCARFLKLDAEELLGDYAAAAPEPLVRSVTPSRSSGAPITISLAPWGAGAVGLLLAIGLVVYLFQGDPDPAPELPGPVAAEPAPAVDTPPVAVTGAPEPQVAAPPPPAPVAASEPPAIATPPEPEPPREAPAPPEEPDTPVEPAVAAVLAVEPATESADVVTQTLTLYFRGESWTEISDRNGRLLFGLQREGIRRELSGEAPFKLLLGNAPAVDLYVDNEPYDLPVGSTRGKVARFVIEPGPGQAFP